MKIITLNFLILSFIYSDLSASPKIKFGDLINSSEQKSNLRHEAIKLASIQNLPVTVLTSDDIFIEAKGIESGKVVYSVITDKADIFNGGHTAFYEDIVSTINLKRSKIIYADGSIEDNSAGKYSYVINESSGADEYLMVTDWTFDRVYLFKKQNGDLVDTAFIPSSPTVLASPKMAMQHFNGRSILVADQITDGVFRFDTNGVYNGLFAPNGGINNSILDNIRGVRYRANNNLLVCVASGASQNTIQQFDTGGVHIGTFISNANLNSPFDILYRTNDILISNSSGPNFITRFDLNGNFLSNFYTGSNFSFPQQLQRLANGNILVAAFISPSGIVTLDSNGSFLRLQNSVTGVRSVYLLDNGRYLVSNGSGIHEVDSSSGALLRTVVTGTSFQYITLYRPGLIVSAGNNNTFLTEQFELSQNFPNPFNPNTKIKYELQISNYVIMKVYDVLGNEVKTLISQKQSAGRYEVEFDGSGLSSGIYYYSIEAGDFKQTKKMILVK